MAGAGRDAFYRLGCKEGRERADGELFQQRNKQYSVRFNDLRSHT